MLVCFMPNPRRGSVRPLFARSRALTLAALVASALLGVPAWTEAQAAQLFQLDPQPVPTGPDDGVLLARPRVTATGAVGVQVRADYGNQPLTVRLRGSASEDVRVLDHRVTGALSLSYGIVERVSLFVTLPFVLHQETRAVLSLAAPATRGLGDLALGMNAHLFGGVDGAQLGVGLALIEPTGSAAAFASDKRIGAVAQLRFAYAANRWSLGATTGVTLRPDREWLTHQTGADLSLVLGAFVHPLEGLRLGLELAVATGLTDGSFLDATRTPVELDLSGRLTLDYGLYVTAAAGLGLVDGVGAPRVRATLALGWASAARP